MGLAVGLAHAAPRVGAHAAGGLRVAAVGVEALERQVVGERRERRIERRGRLHGGVEQRVGSVRAGGLAELRELARAAQAAPAAAVVGLVSQLRAAPAGVEADSARLAVAADAAPAGA